MLYQFAPWTKSILKGICCNSNNLVLSVIRFCRLLFTSIKIGAAPLMGDHDDVDMGVKVSLSGPKK